MQILGGAGMESSTNDLISAQVALSKQKSMGIALILVFFFGPLGLLYGSVLGGIVLIVLPIAIIVVAVATGSADVMGGAFIALLPLALFEWLICLIWAAVAVSGHNRKIERAILKKVT